MRFEIHDSFEIHGMSAKAFGDVYDERVAQDQKWGQQNHPARIWLAILGEEYGELCEATLEYELPHLHDPNGTHGDSAKLKAALRREAVQVAAVAVALIESLDREAQA